MRSDSPAAHARVAQPRELALPLVRLLGAVDARSVLVPRRRPRQRSSCPVDHDSYEVSSRAVGRELREVVYVDGVRTAFGKAGAGRLFWKTRADDMARQGRPRAAPPQPRRLPPERIGDVVIAATAQVGDQGLTLGRDVALLAGLPHTVPGFAVDRMCAGALTAMTAAAGEIAMGAGDLAIAGGVEHMGHHPMGADVDFNPRFVSERLDRRVRRRHGPDRREPARRVPAA